MTLLIATITESVGYLSQDSVIADGEAVDRAQLSQVAPVGSYEEARESAFRGDGSKPTDLFGLGHCCKLTIAPHLHMIAGYTGEHATAIQWDAMLRHCNLAAEISDVHTHAVPEMREQLRSALDRDARFSVVHVGWSFLRRRIKAYAYFPADGWAGIELTGGHTYAPALDSEDPYYAELYSRWEPAAEGKETEQFHVHLAQNIHRTFMRGRYVKGALIGGQLHTARIDGEGISVKVAHVFALGPECS